MEVEDVKPTPEKINMADPAEAHFVRTHTRRTDGTYVVKYPFKEKAPAISSTLSQAVTRLQYMERRFKRDSFLKSQYINFMREYLSLGHMARITPQEVDCHPSECFYLAHHAVLKPDSSTTKCRVVFDGSCKDSGGYSLNERLHIGPPIQRDLFGVCIRFRQHRYVFSADIEKMFRGIMVSDSDTKFQRIVWREDAGSPVEHYRLLTVTYGLAASPFLAVRVLKQLAEDHKVTYPFAARVILNDTYVDDIATGCDNVDELLQLKTELIELLKRANFKLQKWCSNCKPLLETLPRELCERSPIDIASEPNILCVKLLGIQWSPDTDEFQIATKLPESCSEPTKRSVLSTTAKIFDPLGLVSPSVVLFKILLQETWCQGFDWDTKLPPTLSDHWKKILSELHYLSNVRIPRQIAPAGVSIEIHGFADASSSAYAAAVYSRSKLSDDSFVVNLIAAKTRVAPLKPLSIPRLELSAAHLLTKL
ncbi:uncharacterized protein LOC118756836, partial [Rhagoletis pomonella]|uniref:uncharacterized protein LOC118756836 n=1 Tax=Rhagoletis pomonella TaxID=28610 RepID=UPI001781D907